MYDSDDGFHIGPASSMTTFAPASVSTLAAMPPPAPEPTMHDVINCAAADDLHVGASGIVFDRPDPG